MPKNCKYYWFNSPLAPVLTTKGLTRWAMGHRWVGRAHRGLNQDSALKKPGRSIACCGGQKYSIRSAREVKAEIPVRLAAPLLSRPRNRALTPGAVVLRLDAVLEPDVGKAGKAICRAPLGNGGHAYVSPISITCANSRLASRPTRRICTRVRTHCEAGSTRSQKQILGDRGFLALIAEPGMGKTTLLYQLLEGLRDTGARRVLVPDAVQLPANSSIPF